MRLNRTHYCGEIHGDLVGNEVVLSGWVHRWRDHGGVVFIDLRDREGISQIVFDPAETPLVEEASRLRQETVISVKGKIRPRPQGMENPKIPTGMVEVAVSDLEIHSKAAPLPFSLQEDSPSAGEVDESLRLKYRYLDLRRPAMQERLRIRHRFLKSTRDFYDSEGFLEIETPILYKSTPEGARDYLVPSRLHPGKFYALPQSPQTLKQICMISGFDKYFQVARCFRDEDLRADRQPEFTQIDVEMSFVNQEHVLALHERLMQKVFKDVLGYEVTLPLPRLTYPEAMEKYGSDKPDMRNSLTLVDLSEQGKKSEFKVFQSALESGAILKGLCFEEKTPLSRKDLDELPKKVAPYGAKGISWVRIKSPGDWQAPQAKFFPEELKKEIESKLPFSAEKGPLMLLMVCAHPRITNASLSFLRDIFGERYGYVQEDTFAFTWVTDFPLFVYDDESMRLFAAHHPFTNVCPEDRDKYFNCKTPAEAQEIRAQAYDLTLNGYEIGGGSLRIYEREVQARMFELLGMTQEKAKQQFGFFLDALEFGAPPHGGIALGVDRISMILSGTDAIRDVIAFPKTQKASDLMSEAPSDVDTDQLNELSLKIHEKLD